MIQALYVGWLGHQNIGDEACFLSIYNMIRDFAVLTPWDYPDPLPIENPDLLIYGGGTILHLEGWVREKMVLPLVENGVPFIVWGSGIREPVSAKMSGSCLGLLNKARFVGVRGPRSLNALRRGGFYNASVTGDPALFLDRRDMMLCEKRIGLNIGFTGGDLFGDDSNILSKTESLIDILRDLGYEVILFSVLPEDEAIISRIKNKDPQIRPFDPSIESLMRFFSTCEIVISQKLHGCVLAAAAGTPFISLAYREKCNDFADSMGLRVMAVRTDDKDLVSKVVNLVRFCSDRKYIKTTMSTQIEAYRELNKYLVSVSRQVFS